MENNVQILIEDLDRCLARLRSRYGEDGLLKELHRRREDRHDTLRGMVYDLMIERAGHNEMPMLYCLYDQHDRQLPYPPSADIAMLEQKQRELKAQGITIEIKPCC